MPVTQRQLAAALGVTLRAAQKRIARGMPVGSVNAARSWSRLNVGAPRGPGVAAGGSQGLQGSQPPLNHPQVNQLRAQLQAALSDCFDAMGFPGGRMDCVPARSRLAEPLPEDAAAAMR